ncbi:helix-turn-helix domain-containing protein [Xenorhabdus bovienii]|uniref:helix-turn-helix domain-containing protein n=1 Tax=Xenorhabdus bovienii TaxID=40576 RepID=UPI0023B20E89|nr:helix-turn-helix transcriptional regulator [Xenorhabdus bovienii]MDE9536554.1 helix-turn-helix domain-containing protein [Xenorhabdus bovienii]
MSKNDSIALRLIEGRAMLGLSQNALAQQSNVAPAQISRYESGKRKPSAEVIRRMAKALHVPFEWLAHGDVAEPENNRNKSGRTLYAIEVPDNVKVEIYQEAARLGVDPVEFASYLFELGLSVFSHKIIMDKKIGEKK